MNSESTDERIREIAEGIYHDRLTSADVANMDSIAKEVMTEAMARAKSYAVEDADEAARFANEAADGLARMHAAAACASMHPDMRADVLEKLAKKCEVTLMEVLAVYYYLNGGTFAEHVDIDGKAREAADTMHAEEVIEGLLDAMYDRASEFPITKSDEALAALTNAVSHMSAINAFLLEKSGNEDEHTELRECSKSAMSAILETLRTMNYLSGEMAK